MVKVCVVLVGLVGCFDDSYKCTSDEQCDLGEAGRCELDGRCTSFDLSCPTQRRYAAHAGAVTGACFDDRLAPLNACTGGQPPAKPEGCYAAVCERVAACCEVGWTDACVQLAQQECDVNCDTRIAITASRGLTSELYEATWDGTRWTFARRDLLGAPLAWVAPKSGETSPRLSSTTANALVIGDSTLPVPTGRSYQAITSIDFDRDGRDTIVASYQEGNPTIVHHVEIWKQGTPVARDSVFPGSSNLIWGDENRDSFPDAIINNGAQYSFLDNIDGSDRVHKLSNQTVANLSGGATPGAPAVREIDWADLDRDGKLDLVVFGSSIKIHTTPDDLTDVAQYDLDCDPPSTDRACMGNPEPDFEAVAFAGATVAAAAPFFVISEYPGRKSFRAHLDSGAVIVDPLPFPQSGCGCPATCMMCPGPSCTCTYDCSACPPVLGYVVRDLDGDRKLDIVAIDAKLQLFVGYAAANYVFGPATPLVQPLPAIFTTINVSVAGAPIP